MSNMHLFQFILYNWQNQDILNHFKLMWYFINTNIIQVNEKYADIYSKEEIPTLNMKNDKLYRNIPVELLKTPLTQVNYLKIIKRLSYINIKIKQMRNLRMKKLNFNQIFLIMEDN